MSFPRPELEQCLANGFPPFPRINRFWERPLRWGLRPALVCLHVAVTGLSWALTVLRPNALAGFSIRPNAGRLEVISSVHRLDVFVLSQTLGLAVGVGRHHPY